MAVFVDLDEDDCASRSRSRDEKGSAAPRYDRRDPDQPDQLIPVGQEELDVRDENGTRNNVVSDSMSNKLAAALTCYPIALSLSSAVDLNDLHALASTCRSVHASLTQYAYQLKAHSLRCIHDARMVLTEALAVHTEGTYRQEPAYDTLLPGGLAISHLQTPTEHVAGSWGNSPFQGLYASSGVTSKISSCARDLVAPCRRCGTIVCRNCIAKSPSNARMKDRYRRLCKTCLDAPLDSHLQPLLSVHDTLDGVSASSASSIRSERSFSGSSSCSPTQIFDEHEATHGQGHSFTSSAFSRTPCTCESGGVFLCAPCGQNLRAADTTYKRVWTWRSRYSTHIGGGLGTGLGEGNQGQKCGRGEDCLESNGTAVCWVEIDCSERKSHESFREHEGNGSSRMGTPDYVSNKPGYLQQEIEGIGGVVKKKVKKRIKVGATVWEYEDERETGKYLEREANNLARSWCGWCNRVCTGEKDREDLSVKLTAPSI